MKRIGIIVDNYKLDKFKASLTGAGLIFSTKSLFESTTAIFIMVTVDEFESRVREISKICATLEINFKHSN